MVKGLHELGQYAAEISRGRNAIEAPIEPCRAGNRSAAPPFPPISPGPP